MGSSNCGSRSVHGDLRKSKEQVHHLSTYGCSFENTVGRECAQVLPDCRSNRHHLRPVGSFGLDWQVGTVSTFDTLLMLGFDGILVELRTFFV